MTLAVLAGQKLTADTYNQRNPVVARMTGTQALTISSVVQQNITELVVTLPANRTYDIELVLGAFSATAAADVKLDWVVSGTVAQQDGRFAWGPAINTTDASGAAAAAVTVGVNRASTNFLLTSAVSYGVDATGACGAMREKFTVTTGASGGTLQLRAAQNTSSVTAVTVFPGYITCTPIS